MKKIALISGAVIVLLLFISHGLYAQRIYRDDPRIEDDYYDLKLTQEQLEKIDLLEIELEKELSPLFSRLRASYFELDELEAQRNPDPTQIKKIWDAIFNLEDDIQNKEISHEKMIKDLLTEDQRAIFDSYYAYGTNPYRRSGFGRRYSGFGSRGFREGNYAYGRYGGGMRRNYLRRGADRLSRNYYGYGRGISSRYYPRLRYGRGPCGAGLGRWYRWD